MTYEYDNETQFIIQTGRYKNIYKARSIRTGSEAMMPHSDIFNEYESLRVTNGYKKRLVMIKDYIQTILGRYASER